MTEKQRISLEKIISALPENRQEAFREIAEYVMSLGYSPKMNPRGTYADFVKSKHKKTIMKIDTIGDTPRLAIRFDAIPVCFGILQEAVEKRAKECGKYNSCSKCDGSGEYLKKYTLPNGRECYICNAVIDIPAFNVENIPEIKEALRIQDEFLMSPTTT
jgi:hypothetical protein